MINNKIIGTSNSQFDLSSKYIINTASIRLMIISDNLYKFD